MAASMRVSTVVVLAFVMSGCATHLPAPPPNVTVGVRAPTATPARAESGAPPRILAARFSSLDPRLGQTWSGQFVTGTNVASIEVRSNLFSIDVPRTGFGRFAFRADLLDLPPIFIRPYRLRLIARNAAGEQVEEDLPFQIR